MRLPLLKRLLPFFINARTSSGVSFSRWALVRAAAWASLLDIPVAMSPVAPAASDRPRNLRRPGTLEQLQCSRCAGMEPPVVVTPALEPHGGTNRWLRHDAFDSKRCILDPD